MLRSSCLVVASIVALIACPVWAIAAPSPAQPAAARARAAARASHWAEAAAAWAEVAAANPTDGHTWRALGEARAHTPDLRGAIAAYERAIELGDDPATAAYAIADLTWRTRDIEAAILQLKRAFALGYRDLEHARTDPAFAKLHHDNRFLTLAGIPGRPLGAHDSGWKFDLELVAREVHRRGYAPFTRLSASDFDARVQALIASVPKRSDGELVVELAKLLRELGDGHTTILGARRPELAWALPLQLYQFDDGLYVTAADPAWRALVGARIERIDGHPIADVLAAVDPIVSRDNEMWPRAMAPQRVRSTALLSVLGMAASPERATLSVTDASGTHDVAVPAERTHPDIWNALPYPAGWVGLPGPALESRDNDTAYWFERDAAHQLVYVQYNKVADADQLAAFAARVVAAIEPRDKLVIDLRHNNGGDTFANEPFLHALMRVPGLEQRGRLFVIIGRRTYSAAMNAACYLERHLQPIFVGEPTGGKPNSPGDEVPFSLPYSGVIVNISDLYWESGWPDDHRVWIAPELYAPPTIAARRASRDDALEAVIAFTP